MVTEMERGFIGGIFEGRVGTRAISVGGWIVEHLSVSSLSGISYIVKQMPIVKGSHQVVFDWSVEVQFWDVRSFCSPSLVFSELHEYCK